MKRPAAIGISVHSGWGVLIAVTGETGALQILDRRRVIVSDAALPGARQPYHHAEGQDLAAAESHITSCETASLALASEAIAGVLKTLRGYGFEISKCAILQAGARTLPALPQILASHALIHTAEGEYFRTIFRKAAEDHGLQVTGIRDLGPEVFALKTEIAALGKRLGPPWTADQKSATLAAALVTSAMKFDTRERISTNL